MPDLQAAVVTGANRGLGLELCRQLLDRGWLVLAVCRRSSEELAALQRAGAGSPGSLGSLRVIEGVDVGSDSCVAVLQAALAGVSVGWLICNAGVLSVDSVAQLDTAVMRQQFEVNTLGPLRVVHALAANLVPGASKVAFISSKMGSLAATREGGKNGSAGYRMSKAAVNMAGQLLALELRQQSIPLVLIHPGAVATGMYQRYWEAAHGGGCGSAADARPGNASVSSSAPTAVDAPAAPAAGGGGNQGSPGGMAVSAHGVISSTAAAAGVLRRLDELRLEQTGQFVQATTGEVLPW